MPETNHMNLIRTREIVVLSVAGNLYVTVIIAIQKIHISGAIEHMLTYIYRSIGGLC